MLHVLKSEVFIRGGEAEAGGLGPLFLNFLDPALVSCDIRTIDTASD